MGEVVTFDEPLAFVLKLSPVDKARLIERMAPELERELRATRSSPQISLRGLWWGLEITGEEIEQARQEMWNELPAKHV